MLRLARLEGWRQAQDERWQKVVGKAIPKPADDRTAKRKQLHNLMNDRFTIDDLDALFFDDGGDWEQLAGETKGKKVRAIIMHYLHRDGLSKLIEILKKERPSVEWPEL
jgi:hypothetical protein